MRILFYTCVFVLVFAFPWWLSLAAIFLYVLRYTAYEVILLGAFFDAQFTATSGTFVPIYTLATIAMVIGAEAVKPYLSFYVEQT